MEDQKINGLVNETFCVHSKMGLYNLMFHLLDHAGEAPDGIEAWNC